MLPSVLSFLAYAVEKHFSKRPETFGKGNIDGVAAAEASNNAAAMGNLLPLMSLGIPTGPTMALILAALTMYGLTPGPMLFITQAHFVWTVIGSFFVANIILLVLNLPLVGLWVRLATIPKGVLAPVVIVICLVGAFSVRNGMFDIWVCIAFGLIGYLLQRAKWPIAPLVLAYVLGPMIESSARQVYELSPSVVLDSPIFWVFVALSVASLWFSSRLRRLLA
jgi:putative tricarboxylic transport membrane protein